MPTMKELEQMLKDAIPAQASKPQPKPKPVVVAAPPVVEKIVERERIVTIIHESENDFLEKIKEEVRFAVGEERVKVLKGICDRTLKIVDEGLGCTTVPNKVNGKAKEPFPDHGLEAAAKRIVKALNLESMGTTVEKLIAVVELAERPAAGAVQ